VERTGHQRPSVLQHRAGPPFTTTLGRTTGTVAAQREAGVTFNLHKRVRPSKLRTRIDQPTYAWDGDQPEHQEEIDE